LPGVGLSPREGRRADAAEACVAVLAADRDGLRSGVAAVERVRRCRVVTVTDAPALPDIVQRERADLVVIAGSRAPWSELEVVRHLRAVPPRVPIILITSRSSEDLAIAALKEGVDDYFKDPVAADVLGRSVARLLDRASSERVVDVRPIASATHDAMVATSPEMRAVEVAIANVAATDSNVLITGETGTGKELVAGLIHRTSRRRNEPFVAINCAAIPETLIESELFGWERGAFTGALGRQDGKLKLADHGTVFFDEIGDMSPLAQAKILRAIESREIYRLGGRAGVPLDVRVIAATNQDLEILARQSRFRSDLYYRLNVARIHLPPLRDRKEDVPLLVTRYVREFNRTFGRAVESITREGLERLLDYDWPGNVRELRNVIETIFVHGPSGRISVEDLPQRFRVPSTDAAASGDERQRLLLALLSTNWNKSKAAQQLRWSRMTLYRKLSKYHLGSARESLDPRSTR
jgi:DNA-binding NtrC family response regulator